MVYMPLTEYFGFREMFESTKGASEDGKLEELGVDWYNGVWCVGVEGVQVPDIVPVVDEICGCWKIREDASEDWLVEEARSDKSEQSAAMRGTSNCSLLSRNCCKVTLARVLLRLRLRPRLEFLEAAILSPAADELRQQGSRLSYKRKTNSIQ